MTCPHCNGTANKFGTVPQRFADVPKRGPMVLKVVRQRYQCQDCERTFLEPMPELDERRRMTKRLATYIKEHLRAGDAFTDIAASTGLNEKTIRNMARECGAERKRGRPTESSAPSRHPKPRA